jgi:integrase
VGPLRAVDVEPARGHHPLVRRLTPPAALARHRPGRRPRAPSEPADRTRAIPLAELERLWKRDDVAVCEKALWRFLYETAAGAAEALSILVEDIDLDNKRVRVRSKGGDLDWLHFQTGSAASPADRRAPPRPAVPGHPRASPHPVASDGRPLSRDRPGAAVLPARRGAVPPGIRRWTLHQLRHSALTHLAE